MPRIIPQQTDVNLAGGAAPLRAPDVPNTGATVFQGLAGVGEKLADIFGVLQQNSDTIKIANATATLAPQFQQARIDAAQTPDEAQIIPTYKAATDKILQSVTNDPQYSGRIQPAIQSELLRQQIQGIEDLQLQIPKIVENKQHMMVADTQQKLVPSVAGAYDPSTFKDTSAAAQGRQQFFKMVNSLTMYRPEEKQQLLSQFDRSVAMQRAQTVAQNQPAQLDDYIKTLPFALTPEQHQALVTQATDAISQPMKQIDANNAALRANYIQKFNQEVQQNGRVDPTDLNTAITHKFITPEDYQHYTGVAYVEPSDPASVAAANSLIRNATPEDIDEVELAARTNPNIRGKDLVGITGAAAIKKAEFKTAEGKAKADGRDQINKAFDAVRQTPGMAALMYDKMAGANGQLTIAQARAAAVSDWESRSAEIKDPATIRSMAAAAIKANLPDLTKKHPNPSAAGIPARNPGESDADWGKRIRMSSPTPTPSLGAE